MTAARPTPEPGPFRVASRRVIWRTGILWANALVSLLVFLTPTLDGGWRSTVWEIGVLAYWAGAGLLLHRRRRALTGTDFIYLVLGQVAAIATCDYTFRVISKLT
jgi:hypothetical protein